MRPRRSSRSSGLPAPAITAACALAAACTLAAAPLHAQDPAPAATVPLSATSQCVQGPGAPPADPSQVTRVGPGQSGPSSPSSSSSSSSSSPSPTAEAPAEPSLDEPATPGGPPRVLLEGALLIGASIRFDDAPVLETTRRAGLMLGGSMFVWTSRVLAFGLAYSRVDLSGAESPRSSRDVIAIDHDAHTLLAEVRATPIRFSKVALFASVGGGFAWQEAALRAAFTPVDGSTGGSFRCSAGSGAEFAFRAGVGMKARVGRALSLLLDASFLGYRLSAEVLDGCAPGAGTAQTLMVRGGLAYDLDISGLVR